MTFKTQFYFFSKRHSRLLVAKLRAEHEQNGELLILVKKDIQENLETKKATQKAALYLGFKCLQFLTVKAIDHVKSATP